MRTAGARARRPSPRLGIVALLICAGTVSGVLTDVLSASALDVVQQAQARVVLVRPTPPISRITRSLPALQESPAFGRGYGERADSEPGSFWRDLLEELSQGEDAPDPELPDDDRFDIVDDQADVEATDAAVSVARLRAAEYELGRQLRSDVHEDLSDVVDLEDHAIVSDLAAQAILGRSPRLDRLPAEITARLSEPVLTRLGDVQAGGPTPDFFDGFFTEPPLLRLP